MLTRNEQAHSGFGRHVLGAQQHSVHQGLLVEQHDAFTFYIFAECIMLTEKGKN